MLKAQAVKRDDIVRDILSLDLAFCPNRFVHKIVGHKQTRNLTVLLA
jgi:hypothetical protein